MMQWLKQFEFSAPLTYALLHNTAFMQSIEKTPSSFFIEKIDCGISLVLPERIFITITNHNEWAQTDLKTLMESPLHKDRLNRLATTDLLALKFVWIELEMKCRWNECRDKTKALVKMVLHDINERMGIALPLEIFLLK